MKDHFAVAGTALPGTTGHWDLQERPWTNREEQKRTFTLSKSEHCLFLSPDFVAKWYTTAQVTDPPQCRNKQTKKDKIQLDHVMNARLTVGSILSSVTPFPLQIYVSVAERTGLRKQEVGRTMLFLQTGYEVFLAGHTVVSRTIILQFACSYSKNHFFPPHWLWQ